VWRRLSHNSATGKVEWVVDQERGAGHNLDIDGNGRMEVICGGSGGRGQLDYSSSGWCWANDGGNASQEHGTGSQKKAG